MTTILSVGQHLLPVPLQEGSWPYRHINKALFDCQAIA
jgi:hypothetical protein